MKELRGLWGGIPLWRGQGEDLVIPINPTVISTPYPRQRGTSLLLHSHARFPCPIPMPNSHAQFTPVTPARRSFYAGGNHHSPVTSHQQKPKE